MVSENKNLLCIMNAIVGIFGLLQLIFGFVLLKDVKNLYDGEDAYVFKQISGDRSFSDMSYIIFGAIIIVISLTGICIALMEVRRIILLVYGLLFMMGIMALLFLTIYTLWIMVWRSDLAEDYSKKFEASKSNETIRSLIESIEKNNSCCGVQSFNDYTNDTLPSSCFSKSLTNVNEKKPFIEGCSRVYSGIFYIRVGVINGNYVWLAEFEFISLICSIIMFYKIKRTCNRSFGTNNRTADSTNILSVSSVKFIE